mgnify:CR=1 FL=1
MTVNLTEFKKQYNEFMKKYNLPSFKELNENFEIDKIDRETECILRIVRKVMMEKIVNSLGFLEMLINPMNAPRIYLSYIKSITNEDKQSIEKIYTDLGEVSLFSLDLEIDYSEKKEAELIKRVFNVWNSLKPEFRRIMENMKKPGIIEKKEKSYFG